MNKNYLENLKKFIEIKSTGNNYEGLVKTIHFVREYFTDIGLENDLTIREFEYQGIPSIVVSNSSDRDFDVILSGHMDVVDAKDDMFELQQKDDHLIGRGVADMKGSVLVMMDVFKELISQKKLNYKIALMLTTDEESGGQNGVHYLLEEQGYNTKLAIIPDGGKKLNVFEEKNKGFFRIALRSYGRSAHGSRPWLGQNAITKLMMTINEVSTLFNKLDPNIWQKTMNIGVINGGTEANRVPDFAEAHLDIRYTENDNFFDLLKDLQTIADKNEVELIRSVHGYGFALDREHLYVKKYIDLIKKYCDDNVEFYQSEGASDARFFAGKKIPVLVHQSDCGGLHMSTEWASLSSLKKYQSLLTEYLISLNEIM